MPVKGVPPNVASYFVAPTDLGAPSIMYRSANANAVRSMEDTQLALERMVIYDD